MKRSLFDLSNTKISLFTKIRKSEPKIDIYIGRVSGRAVFMQISRFDDDGTKVPFSSTSLKASIEYSRSICWHLSLQPKTVRSARSGMNRITCAQNPHEILLVHKQISIER